MSTSSNTSSTDSQMHNNIMAAGSKDRPPMLGPGRYSQWRSCFLRYIDTKNNGEGLKKCILNGPYVPTSVLIQAVPAAEGRPAVQQHTAIETVLNMTPENKEHFQSEKEAIFLLLTGIGDEIYSTVDACNTTNEMWIAIERLQQGDRLNVQDVKTNLFWEFGNLLSRDENPWSRITHTQILTISTKTSKINATSSSTRQSASTRHKGPTIAKPSYTSNLSLSLEEDMILNKLESDKEKCKQNLALFGKEQRLKIPHQAKESGSQTCKDYSYTRKRGYVQTAEQGFHNKQQADWLEGTDEEIDERKLEAHYSYMAKIQEVSPEESSSTSQPLEQKDDSNVTPDSSNIFYQDHSYVSTPNGRHIDGRLTLAKPSTLSRKAQSEKPRLYEIPYDTSDPANRFAPDREETMTLDNESRSKLNKDYVKPYDYTKQNSLYEIFKAPSLEYLYQLERGKEVRNTMWRKPFVRTKPNIAKNVAFLPVSESQ
ncbi:hypothetical protein Tco_0751918 [Tanacetum coccineum]|uniref:Uncharacterized protein n=1 Tax=Tanacetum coccineum TaxID=301880 RepID=A0ABQ4Z8N4_9ASTR